MASNSVLPSFPVFNDVDGNPLESGYIYIGDPGFNPEVAPKSVYWDEGLTTPAVQPIRTSGGYPYNSGTPAMIYTDGDFSITVRNKNGTLIYTSLNNTFLIDIDALQPDISKVSRALYVENTSGVADSLTLVRPDATISEVLSYFDGLTLMFDNTLTNTGAVTASLDGLTVKKVRTSSDADLTSGAILAGVTYFMVYNSALDSGAGAFELKDMQPQDTYNKLWDPQATTHNFTSDANYTITATQNLYGRIVLTDTTPLLTASRSVIVDNVEKRFFVTNETLQDLTVKTSAGTGVLVQAGKSELLVNDGTDVLKAYTNSNPTYYMELRYELATGAAGQTITAATNTQLNLNTVVSNNIDGASLSANNVTLPAGTYYISSGWGYISADSILSWLEDTTSAEVYIRSKNNFTQGVYGLQSIDSIMRGYIVLPTAKTFKMMCYVSAAGAPTDPLNIAPWTEIYQQLVITKVD